MWLFCLRAKILVLLVSNGFREIRGCKTQCLVVGHIPVCGVFPLIHRTDPNQIHLGAQHQRLSTLWCRLMSVYVGKMKHDFSNFNQIEQVIVQDILRHFQNDVHEHIQQRSSYWYCMGQVPGWILEQQGMLLGFTCYLIVL